MDRTERFSLVKMNCTRGTGSCAGGSNQISPMRCPAGAQNGAGSTSRPHGFST